MPSGEQGHTLVAVLALTAWVAVAVAAAGPVWSQLRQREREAHLVQVGRAYAAAIARYRRMSPGAVPEWPASLDELLLDRRFVGTVRHLRRLYPDPMTRGLPWLAIQDKHGRIVGVRSSSMATPVARVAPDGARWIGLDAARLDLASQPASLPTSPPAASPWPLPAQLQPAPSAPQPVARRAAPAPCPCAYTHWAFLAEDVR